ncbi:cytochrome P450 [Vararia minispora EC-137]|uniref:Cytochrome P450 n=1 Tax=Vararia minispora EC-137 TaxID=1314806 RepID=A0ACB8QSE9_9AGAM|nr:cytochrome P450 [Vararia minispora EC-137]
MSSLLIALALVLFIVLAYLLHPLVWLIASLCFSPLARLPSPPSPSFLLGNLAAIADQENNDVITSWTRTYGSTFTYRGFIGGRRLLTTDPTALNYILGHAYDYPKPEFVRASLSAMVAGEDGLLTVEGDIHRRQNQAFTAPHIRSLVPIFVEKATELRDLLCTVVDAPVAPPSPPPPLASRTPRSPVIDSFAILRSLDPVRPKSPMNATFLNELPSSPGVVIDILSYLARATLDVIGSAGFGYTFNALAQPHPSDPINGPAPDNELASAFAVIFETARKFRVLSVFQSWFPLLRRYQPNGASIKAAQATIRRVGSALIDERLEDIGLASVGRTDARPRDLLSVLVSANDASGPSALSREEIASQISTFLAAGHETSASALTWTLYALARSPQEQGKLRAALLRLPDDASTDNVLTLPELDYVVRESLRLHAPVSSTMRVYAGAAPETVVPLSRGVRVRAPRPLLTWHAPAALAIFLSLDAAFGWSMALAVMLCAGVWKMRANPLLKGECTLDPAEWMVQDHVRLRRGDIITIPIQAINRDPEVWGEDAREFRPSRWLQPPPNTVSINGLYPRTLTFLNGSPINGNRACIGFRFAIAEIKVFLCVLLRSLEFSIDDDIVIEKRVNVVTRPFVASAPELGNQMPLRVRRVLS